MKTQALSYGMNTVVYAHTCLCQSTLRAIMREHLGVTRWHADNYWRFTNKFSALRWDAGCILCRLADREEDLIRCTKRQ